MFLGKNKVSTSRRPSATMENGHITSKSTNLLNPDETKRTSQQHPDGPLTQHQYGKTLNVPDSNSVLHVLPLATPPAPLVPPRPAIMSTPKSSVISVKNPSTSIALSPTETRPLLLVTTDSDQNSPQTTTVPNSRRLPVNGRMATVISTKQRQQPTIPTTNNHQMVNETVTQKISPRKFTNNRPRTALFFTSTRMKTKQPYFFMILIINLGGPDQSPEQHQPLLGSSGNDTSSRHDSIDSHASTDDVFGLNDNWSAASRLVS